MRASRLRAVRRAFRILPGRLRTFLITLLALLASSVCMSGVRVYSYVDENGTTHFTDIPVDESEVAADVMTEDFYDDCGENEVQLAIRDEDGDYAVYITNLIASPVTVTLHVSHPEYVESDIDFSKIYRIGEGKTEPLGYISYSDSGVFELSFTCSIGTPTFDMKEYSGNEFIIPFYGTYRVTQAPGGKLSHSGPASRYAVDISMPIGTPVRASRRGRVVNMKMNSTTGGPSPAYRPFANFIRILHDDGTSSIYVHLKGGSAMVSKGQMVETGQVIAYSGNTGYTTGPHLHFAVQHNNGVRNVGIPFRFAEIGRMPKWGESLTGR